MLNRRHSVLSSRCSYDHRLGVLGVAKINMSMRMLCVCGVLVCTNVCVCECDIRVVFAYKYYTHIPYSLLFFIHEIYFRVTSLNPFRHQSLNVEVFNTRMTTAMTSLYTDCLCYLPALVACKLPDRCVTYQSLLSM